MRYATFLVFVFSIVNTKAEFDCLCVLDNHVHQIYQEPNVTSKVLGYLPPNQCKYFLYPVNAEFDAIMAFHQKGFIHLTTPGMKQICAGRPPLNDIFTTSATMSHYVSTTKGQHLTDIQTSRTTIKVQKSTSEMVSSVTTASPPSGHKEICPDYIKNTDVNRYHGFLGQYGDFCYELIDTPTQWGNAERHCGLVSQGHLVHILNQDQQDYIVKFLNDHHYIKAVWIGLTDSGSQGQEGIWRWISGETYQYNSFQGDFASHSNSTHKLNDCVILKQGGEWTDANCGTTFGLGIGFGESHPYICQYNVSHSLPSIVDANMVVG